MAIRNNNLTFLTPDRRPIPDTTIKGFSTTAAQPFFKNLRTPEQSQSSRSQMNERVQDNKNSYGDKLNWFQSKATELREYINECARIDKRKIRQIFNWEQKVGQEQSQERKLLKELGSNVRRLIKQNNKLKHTIYNGEITQLRIENQRLKYLLDNIHKGEASNGKIIIEENELMQNYIERQKIKKMEERIQQNSTFHLQNHYNYQEQKAIEEVEQAEDRDEPKQPLFNATPLSIERLKNLKQYFTMYVNTAIEQNDQKLNYQQKYIDSLEKRITQLQSINQKLEHLTFQKKVKLQQSQRKARNFTAKAPQINGDDAQDQHMNSQTEERQPEGTRRPQVVLPVNYYRKKQRTTQNIEVCQDLQQQVERLRSENRILKYDLQNLRQKYEVEIEKHIRDISEKQNLVDEIQKLTFENKQWEHKVVEGFGMSV